MTSSANIPCRSCGGELPKEEARAASEDRADPVAGALADALRRTFLVFRLLIVGVLVAFFLSGLRWVEEGTVGLHLRFGQIQGEPGRQVMFPGGPYFLLPEPIDEIVLVPTAPRTIALDKAFWPAPDSVRKKRDVPGLLVPGEDGSLLTADQNLVHGRWSVQYVVATGKDAADNTAPVRFALQVGSLERADELVRNAAEQACVRIVAQTGVDDFLRGQIDNERIKGDIQQTLDALDCGITVSTVSLQRNGHVVPDMLQHAFLAVTQAESEKALWIEQAERYRANTMQETAGPGHEQLLPAIAAYEAASEEGNAAQIAALEQEIENIFHNGRVGGEAAERINEARAYRVRFKEAVRGYAARFRELTAMSRRDADILRQRLLQNALHEIFSGNARKILLPAGGHKTIYVDNAPPSEPNLVRRDPDAE